MRKIIFKVNEFVSNNIAVSSQNELHTFLTYVFQLNTLINIST